MYVFSRAGLRIFVCVMFVITAHLFAVLKRAEFGSFFFLFPYFQLTIYQHRFPSFFFFVKILCINCIIMVGVCDVPCVMGDGVQIAVRVKVNCVLHRPQLLVSDSLPRFKSDARLSPVVSLCLRSLVSAGVGSLECGDVVSRGAQPPPNCLHLHRVITAHQAFFLTLQYC